MVHPRGVPADERGKSISVTAEADRTYRGGLVPAKFVRDQWGRWVQMIFSIWQTEVNCMASNTRHEQRCGHVLVRQQQSQQQPDTAQSQTDPEGKKGELGWRGTDAHHIGDSPVLDRGQREDRWTSEGTTTTKSWPDVPSPWVCGCGAKWVRESDEERAITVQPLTIGLPSSSSVIVPCPPTDALALQQQQHQPEQPQQPPYRPIFATFSDSELEGLARDVDAELSRRQGGQPRWGAINIQVPTPGRM